MSFDVAKFLALTAMLATASAACTVVKDNDDDNTAGTGNVGASGSAGAPGAGGVAGSSAGAGGDSAGSSGEGGSAMGGSAGSGGETAGSAGQGGTGGAEQCLGELSIAGSGGEAGGISDPGFEDLCSEFRDIECDGADEGDLPAAYILCERTKEYAKPAVIRAVGDCLKALSAQDVCDQSKVAACLKDLTNKACVSPESTASCEFINSKCNELSVADCKPIADLYDPEQHAYLKECMDPGQEGWFDETFTGTCSERIWDCAGVAR